MSSHKMGQIPFVSKFLAKRRLRVLGDKVDKMKVRFDELGKEIESAKEKAAGVLTKKEYDVVDASINEKIDGFCEIEGEAKSKPSGPTKADVRKMCKESLFKQGKISRAGGSGQYPSNEKSLIDDCVKKGTGQP